MATVALGVTALLATAKMARAEGPDSDVETVRVGGQGATAGGFVARGRLDDGPREVSDAAGLVEGLPGVHVRRLGAEGSFATLSVRGSSSTQVMVLLAGVPLTGGADPTVDLATLPLWPGAQARVYRTFAPAALGPGSLGGTLALDGPSPNAATGTEIWGAVGSFGARRIRVGHVGALGEGEASARYTVALSASRADDDFLFMDPTASRPGRDVMVRRQNAGHAGVNGLASMVLPLGLGAGPRRMGHVTVTTLAQARQQELPGTVRAPTPLARLDTDRQLASLQLDLPAGEASTFAARLWGRREGLHTRDGAAGATLTLGPTASDDAIVAAGGAVSLAARPEETLRWEGRVDGYGEVYSPGRWVGATAPPGATRTAVGAGMDLSYRGASWLTLTATARGDLWRDGDVSGGAAPGPRSSAPTEVQPTAHLGGEVTLAEGARGTLSAALHGGRVARPPSFVERFGNRGAFLGDPGLRPEKAWAADGGVRGTFRQGVLRLRGEAVAFGAWAEDLIVFVGTGAYGRARATNIGEARNLGTEVTADLEVGPAGLRASYTYLATADQTRCRTVAGAFGPGSAQACERPPLPGRPAHDLTVDGRVRVGPAVLRYGVDVVSGLTTDLTGSTAVPPRALQSAGVAVELGRVPTVRLGAEVRNLFDVRVASYAGVLGPVRFPVGDLYEYPLPGRSGLVTARLTFP